MRGESRFTQDEAARIRELLSARLCAELPEAKRLRHELREIGFYISDWEPSLDASGFNALVNEGAIMIGGPGG